VTGVKEAGPRDQILPLLKKVIHLPGLIRQMKAGVRFLLDPAGQAAVIGMRVGQVNVADVRRGEADAGQVRLQLFPGAGHEHARVK